MGRTMPSVSTSLFLKLIVMMVLACSYGFLHNIPPLRPFSDASHHCRFEGMSPSPFWRRESTSRAGFVVPTDFAAIETTAASVSNVLQSYRSSAIEVQVLTDCAHVASDFPLLFGKRSKTVLQVMSLTGRVLGLMADYIPDHSIRYDELSIQLILLSITLRQICLSITKSI